jgi:hypothetical protein
MHREHFRSAHITVRVPRGKSGYWAIMLRLHRDQGCFTVRDVDGESNTSIKHISKYLKALVAAGFVEQVSTRRHGIAGKYPTPLYRLVKQPVQAPRVRDDGSVIPATAQEQIWIAIRNLKVFKLAELRFASTTDDVMPKSQTVARFVRFLEAAGYLAVVSSGRRGIPQTWRLKPGMNTGPLPPQLKQLDAKVVWDPNIEKFIGEAPIANEVQP